MAILDLISHVHRLYISNPKTFRVQICSETKVGITDLQGAHNKCVFFFYVLILLLLCLRLISVYFKMTGRSYCHHSNIYCICVCARMILYKRCRNRGVEVERDGGRSICLGLLSGASLYSNDLQLVIIMPKHTHKLSEYSKIMLSRFIAYEIPKLCRNMFGYGGAVRMMMWQSVVARLTVAFVEKLFACRRKIE